MACLRSTFTAFYGWSFAFAIGTWAQPAFATSCDTKAIQGRSVQEAAAVIYDSSDYLGFGFVRQISDEQGVKQQEADIVVPLKGEMATLKLSPDRASGVSRHDGNIRWYYWKPDEMRLIALVKSPDGAVTPTCLAANIASKPAPELFRALVSFANRRSGLGKTALRLR